jgi:hypothetical protein
MDTPASAALALRWAFDRAIAGRARTITASSASFEGWPFEDATLLSALAGWLRLPQRRLVLLGAGFATMSHRFPRFEQWRRDWVHAVPAWRCPADLAQGLPEALFDDGNVSVQLFDAQTGRGRASLQRSHCLLLVQQTDVVLQRSEPSWPGKALGL